MEKFSVKEYLSLKMPTEEVAISDHKWIELALHTLGYAQVTFPLPVLRKLYPLCRNAGFDITVTLVRRGSDWVENWVWNLQDWCTSFLRLPIMWAVILSAVF